LNTENQMMSQEIYKNQVSKSAKSVCRCRRYPAGLLSNSQCNSTRFGKSTQFTTMASKVFLFTLALLIASCDTTEPEPTQDTVGQNTATSGETEYAADGTAIDNRRVGCPPSGPYFPVSALDSAPPLIADSSVPDTAAAIAPFLESGEGEFWSQIGWRVLEVVDNEKALLVNPTDGLEFMTLAWVEKTWDWSGSSSHGDCILVVEPLASDGSVVDWTLANPEQVNADSTVLQLLATEVACTSGQPIGDRLHEPEVTYTSDAILIKLTAEPLSGSQNCPGIPAQPVQVELAEPVGERKIVDARSTDLGELRTLLLELIALEDQG